MDQSFYNFVLTYRDPIKKDGLTLFANQVGEDVGFPRTTSDYYDLADYLELSGEYSEHISHFDEIYRVYQERQEQAAKTMQRDED